MTMSHERSSMRKSHPRLAVLGSGVAAGLVATLALSGLMLLAERVALLPVGTFYLALSLAVSRTADYGIYSIVQGLLMHLAAGAALGLVISAPFAVSRKAYGSLARLGPAYGLGAGVLIWLALFMPITYGIMLPLLKSLQGSPEIRQSAPAGEVFKVAVGDLLRMMDRVVYTALAFNMLYGLVALILIRSFAGSAPEKKNAVVL